MGADVKHEVPRRGDEERYGGQQAPPEAQPGTDDDPTHEREEQRQRLSETVVGHEAD